MAFDGSVSDIVIDSMANTLKIPGFYGETNFAASPIKLQNVPLKVLLVGLKTSAGSLVNDQDVSACISDSAADTLAGPGSELARMAYIGLANCDGPLIFLAAVAPNGSAVAATATITISGTTSSSGTWIYFMCGITISVSVIANETATTVAARIAAAINAQTKLPWTAANVAGVITLTAKCAGIRGNEYIVYQDTSQKPGTQTSACTGGSTALSSVSTQTGCKFTSGSGAEDVTTLLAATLGTAYDRQVWAANDTTNLPLIEAQVDTKALPGTELMEHFVVGHTGTSGTATSVAQTTLNTARAQLVWLQNCEIPSPEIASAMACRRAQDEQREPNTHYNNVVLKGVPPLRYDGYKPTRATIQSCLDNSITPLQSSKTAVSVVRSITTRSLNGTTPDWRCLDTGMAYVPDYIRRDTKIFWDQEVVLKNKWAQDDPAPGEEKPTAQTMTPKLWAALMYDRMLGYQKRNMVIQVAANPPKAKWNSAGMGGNGCIMSIVPVIVKPYNHAIGVKFLQQSAA